ncbi:glutathione S-transferase family protein [Kineobactrum salinum]|uniref:Glutathione S-transferase family protein n=2 Tax=Kineobactrum salinum TaxID=2708301 RepID=A0A6C0U0T5_9GAMM|nr:glutathione S-transferase family protein [Kineobactrum salinum]
MATCARKALVVAFEKGLDFEYCEVEREFLATDDYRRLNPKGLVPTLVREDGEVLYESSLVIRYLDESDAKGIQLQPADPLLRARMNGWLKDVDELYFAATGALTVATFIRFMVGDPINEDKFKIMLDSIPDPVARRFREVSVRQGIDSEPAKLATQHVPEMLHKIETSLAQQQWLSADHITLADCAVFPLMLRLEELGLDEIWQDGYPRLKRWWATLNARRSVVKIRNMAQPEITAGLKESARATREELVKRMTKTLEQLSQ